MALTKRKKQPAVRTPRSLDKKYMGQEPVIASIGEDEWSKMIRVYSWYNYFYTLDDAKAWLYEYIENTRGVTARNRIKESKSATANIGITACISARLLNRGTKLCDRSIDFLNARIEAELAKDEVPAEAVESKTPDIQGRIREQVSQIIADFEDEVDRFIIESKAPVLLSPYEYLKSHEVKPLLAKKVAEYYAPIEAEGDKTGYGKYISMIIADCNAWATNQTKQRVVTRKPRKRKEVSAAQKVAKVSYKTEDSTLKIASVSPTEILGAKQVWIYNTKYKTLSVYYPADKNDLGIKGTTITAFDDTASAAKTLRKPEEQLKMLMTAGKVKLRTFFDEIKTVKKTVTGRINSECLIIRCIK